MSAVRCPVMVGRDVQLEALGRAVDRTITGEGGVVVVAGEAGVGKSRMVREVSALAGGAGLAVLRGRAVATGDSTPYRPFSEAILSRLRTGRLPADEAMAPWLAAISPIVPLELTGLTGVGPGESSPAVRGEGVLRVIAALTGGRGAVVALEDLHWADPDTLDLLRYIADNVGSVPLLWLVTGRPSPRTGFIDLCEELASRGSAVRVDLERLDPTAAAAMVRACAPDASLDVVRRVVGSADGVPLLVEELLASPGVPTSFAASVASRMAGFDSDAVAVLETAAVLGRFFDWRLLGPASGRAPEVVDRALRAGAAAQLLEVDGERFRFRHALTREAVLADVAPHRRQALAMTALAALDDSPCGAGAPEAAADLAVLAGDRSRASALLLEAGRVALGRGALATAASAFAEAAATAGPDTPGGHEARRAQVEALALAGRVEEASRTGGALIADLSRQEGTAKRRAEVHLMLAQAAVAAARWADAAAHLDQAEGLSGGSSPRSQVLRAELAIADGDRTQALEVAATALHSAEAGPDVRCYSLELIGRAHRNHDPAEARRSFEEALGLAERERLPVWRMRALHELGTLEMFDHAGTARLVDARRAAEDLGALSTAAVLDMHLAAAHMFSFELTAAEGHATAALELSARLGYHRLHTLSLMFLAQIHALRADRPRAEHFAACAAVEAPGDPEIDGSNQSGTFGMLALLEDDRDAAIDHLNRGEELLQAVPDSGPACYRGLFPLLLAAAGHVDAVEAIARARRSGMEANRANRGLLVLAEAVLAGRSGGPAEAAALAAVAQADLAAYRGWTDIAGCVVGEAAQACGWGQPDAWLRPDRLRALGLGALAGRCDRLLGASPADRWALTARERDVLALVREGLANKQIASRLFVSPRTVEKHVESLLRKTGARSRAHLVAITVSG